MQHSLIIILQCFRITNWTKTAMEVVGKRFSGNKDKKVKTLKTKKEKILHVCLDLNYSFNPVSSFHRFSYNEMFVYMAFNSQKEQKKTQAST